MAYRRKYNTKKSRAVRRRPGRSFRSGKSSKYALCKTLNNHGLHFWKEKKMHAIPLHVDANGNYSAAMIFQVADLLNFQESAGPPVVIGAMPKIFDYYQIRGVQVKFYPVSQLTVAGTANIPYANTMIAYKKDYDDATPIPTFANAMESDCKVRQFDRPITVFLRPRVQQQINSTVAGGVGAPVTAFPARPQNLWCDMRHMDVQHLGLKFIINSPGNPAGQVQTMKVVATYYVALKGQL